MAPRGWTAVLLLFAVLAMHGLQCGSAADGAPHDGSAPVVTVIAMAAPAAGDAHHVDAAAHSSGPLALSQDGATAAAPDGSTVLATTAQGLLRSTDTGTMWAAIDRAPLLQVGGWADAGTAVGIDPAGVVWTTTDAAGTWQQTADLGAAPHAVAAAPADGAVRIAVVTDAGLAQSLDGGATFTTLMTS